MKKTLLVMPLVLGLLFSCQVPSRSHRKPSSSEFTEKKFQESYNLQLEIKKLSAEIVDTNPKSNQEKYNRLFKEREALKEKLKIILSDADIQSTGESEFFPNIGRWRVEKEKIQLTQLELYKLENGNNIISIPFNTNEAKENEIELTHLFFKNQNSVQTPDQAPPFAHFVVNCDNDFKTKYGVMTFKVEAKKNYSFNLKDEKKQNDYHKIILNSDNRFCRVRFTLSTDNQNTQYGFDLVNEQRDMDKLFSLNHKVETCTLPSQLNSALYTEKFANLTCPHPYDSIKILPEPEDSLHARVIALLGKDLPADFLKNGNPYAELDFSDAPQLDAILVSYLVFRADFYGTVLSRILEYHASKGAQVRILVSDVISLDKDRVLYEKIRARNKNFKISIYRYDTSQDNGSKFSEFHRNIHVKLFITYSRSNPENSSVIVGGRNVHDGFVFKKPINVDAYPEVVNYEKGDESWAYWRDFEMMIKGQEFVESVIKQYLNIYQMNKENLMLRPSSISVKNINAPELPEKSIRHYTSIPFKDDPNLNALYARMIDSAEKKILISSPYFRPVKEIGEALDRAILRGVDITIITRLDLDGDTADFILGAVNKDGVNRFLKKVKVYEYTENKVILHSKLMMIDDQMTFVSSVNLNKRSFYHDFENGVMVKDREFTVKMGELYKEYLKESRLITEKQKIAFWKRWLIKVLDKVF